MGKPKIAVAGILLLSGLIFYTQVDVSQIAQVQKEVNFEHSYPYNGSWSANGTHQGTTNDSQGNLVIENPKTGKIAGFESKKQIFNGSLEVERFTAKASFINDTKHKANITFYSLDSGGAVIESRRFDLTEKDKLYNLNLSKPYSGYSFDIILETSKDTSPEVCCVTVQGVENVDTDTQYNFKTIVTVFLILSSLYIGFGG